MTCKSWPHLNEKFVCKVQDGWTLVPLTIWLASCQPDEHILYIDMLHIVIFLKRKKKLNKKKKSSANQISTFSLQGSFLMTSGAIHDTVPAKDILVLFSFHSRLVPKSEIFTTSFLATSTLRWKKSTHCLYGQKKASSHQHLVLGNTSAHSHIKRSNISCTLVDNSTKEI